jgi:hypothetical protein
MTTTCLIGVISAHAGNAVPASSSTDIANLLPTLVLLRLIEISLG